MRWLLCMVMCVYSALLYAKPYVLVSEISISNDHWYPLSQHDMKSAAVDTALSELTQSGRFVVVHENNGNSTSPADGNLKFDISLIGPAEVVKLTMTLQLKNMATHVSTVSLDIHGLDYQGIYNAFEYVGREAAKRLNAKIAMLKASPEPSPDSALAADESGRATGEALLRKQEIIELFNHAQDLKRQEQYHDARALYERIINLSERQEPRLSAMAKDELRFGLPIFEADNMMLDNVMQEPSLVAAKMEKIQHLYRQILADNTDNPQRMMEMHRRLDNVSISRKSLARAMEANSLASATRIRVMLYEYFMTMGTWPNHKVLEAQLKDSALDFEVISYQADDRQLTLVLKDPKYGTQVELRGDMKGVTIRVKG